MPSNCEPESALGPEVVEFIVDVHEMVDGVVTFWAEGHRTRLELSEDAWIQLGRPGTVSLRPRAFR